MDIRYSCNQRDFKRYTTEETQNGKVAKKLSLLMKTRNTEAVENKKHRTLSNLGMDSSRTNTALFSHQRKRKH